MLGGIVTAFVVLAVVPERERLQGNAASPTTVARLCVYSGAGARPVGVLTREEGRRFWLGDLIYSQG
jgi:hypothetical protein